MPSTRPLWALVLAGGDGTRLQGLTRRIAGAPIPKQYCRIAGGRSLLEATLARIAPAVPPARTLAVVNRDHLALARPQLRSLPPRNVIVQPRNRDTGPGLVLSLLHLARRRPEARVAVFPSDHHVADGRAFLAHVERARRIVDRLPDKVALLGIAPEAPEPGLGYIEPGRPVAPADAGAAFHVAAFREKPSPAAAAHLVARGGLWNSFVMVFDVGRMLALLRATRPDDVARLEAIADQPAPLEAAYASLPSWNFSHDVLVPNARHLLVVRADGTGWSDWGTPEAVFRTLAAGTGPLPWWAAAPAAPTAVAL